MTDNKPVYFISDIHLNSNMDNRYGILIAWLKSIEEEKARLVMLGDIFDLWVGAHEYFITEYSELIESLRRMLEDGWEIHFFEGNHDLYLKKFWEQDLGMSVHGDEHIVNWQGLRIRMEHGDKANPDDKGYLFLRSFLRNPVTSFVLNHIPGKIIGGIGDKASKASRRYTDTIDVDSKELIRKYAERLSEESNFDVLITGHTHQKDIYTFNQNKRSINLGSWFGKIEYLKLQNGEFEFVTLPEFSN
ncbi:MAG: UDP-2,3-diacylglucosamine diphosphatase [Bdellovibrionales bacterium]